MARLVKPQWMRSYEHYVWFMTGRHYEVTFDVRPLEIGIRGGYKPIAPMREFDGSELEHA